MIGAAAPVPEPALLSVEDLRVAFTTRGGTVEALRGVSLAVRAGERLGLVGESGSGKSVTAFAAARLLDGAGRITGGRIRFRDRDVTRLSGADLRLAQGRGQGNGAAIGMIFQNPRAALNPIRPIGLQLTDVLRNRGHSRAAARARALDALEAVQIRDAARRLDAYPHELSGGMCQRVMIALALAAEPALLIADEPTTGLDVTTQKTVMDLVSELTARRGMAMILITHDLGLAARYCGRIAVMEAGRLVEEGPPGVLFSAPRHPYTARLVAASPTPTSTLADLAPETPRPTPRMSAPAVPPRAAVLLEVRGVEKRYGEVTAVEGVSFAVRAGESLGLVGESGSGKSTLSRLICRLIDPSAGEILFDGDDIGAIPARDFHRSPLRRAIQIVFQDPDGSLNPRFSAYDSIAHPVRRLTDLRGEALRRRVIDCAERAGLGGDLLGRFPHQLSGGQKARVGIARAIAVRPRLLILDEPTAALDVSVQAGVLRLLDDLRREDGLGVLFVSHDLNVVRMMCERTIVLQAGRVVEEGDSRDLFSAPRSAYTRALLAAIPHFRPGAAQEVMA